MIYLDYAASAPPFPEVLELVNRTALESFANPGALHGPGASARKTLHHSRNLLARLLHVRPEEVFFTSGGTESNNWAIRIGSQIPGKKHLICSATEHSSVLEPLRNLEKNGYAVTYLKPDSRGILSPEAMEAAIRADTALLCIQAVNNETGVLQDIDALSQIARKHRVRFFCDAVQSFGHVHQNLNKADIISLSAHKLGGPRGAGCLIVRLPLIPTPLLYGGGQEFGLRSGTENLPAIAGFALAAQLALDRLDSQQQRLANLCRMMEDALRSLCPNVQFAGTGSPRSSILSCRFPGISAEELVIHLDAAGICASPGAACAARNSAPSHVLLAMGYPPREASEFVRFSLGRNTTEAEIQETIASIQSIYQNITHGH